MSSITVSEMLERARSGFDRVAPSDLSDAVSKGAIVVDVRDSAQRSAQGDLPGAHIIDLTVLEWRLAPSSPSRIMDVAPDQEVILVCRQGCSSSLAASRLRELGLSRATDLIGGYEAWRAHVEGR
ncbi:MAG TPA: rhodanese-like domain-containing protein [Acidimicrobiia bacterium]|nr:rhodanese-like domain-containing protein [Acidimicrobiia bacterium]